MFSSTWMDIEIVVLNEVNREAGTLYDAPDMIQMNLFTKQKQTQRSYLWLPGKKDEGKG